MRSLIRTVGSAALLALGLALFGSPTSVVAIPEGQPCSNAQALECDGDLRCYDNVCLRGMNHIPNDGNDGSIELLPNGFGNACSSTDCCPTKQRDGSDSRLVCNKISQTCLPRIPMNTEIVCGGGEYTPPIDSDVPDQGGHDNDDDDDNGDGQGNGNGDGGLVIDNPPPGETIVDEGSSGTTIIQPDGSVDTETSAAPQTQVASALVLVAGLAVAAIML